MDASRRKGRRRRRRALVAFALSSGLALVGAELVCRKLYGIPMRERLPIMAVRAHPTRGYAMLPETEHYTYEQLVRVNALGLRGPEVPPKERGELRILCLGDSTTYGQGLAEEDTLPACLERALERAPGLEGRRIRVVNGGLRAYGTEQELALLRELGPTIEADLVVLCWYPNDLEWPDIARMFSRLDDEGRIVFDTQTHLVKTEKLKWRLRQILRRSALLMQVHDVVAAYLYERLTPAEIEDGFRRLELLLGSLAVTAESQGSELLVAAIPTAGMVASEDVDRTIVVRTGLLAVSRGLPFVDLTEPLRGLYRRTGKLPVLPYDGHYTGEANEVMAEALASAVRERIAAGR